MTRAQVMVQLTDELVDLLDAEAAHREMSRSALIREALRIHLTQAHRAMIGRAIVAGYRRVPPSSPDGWSDLGRQGDASTRELLQRLHAEEQAEGHGPW